MRRDQRERMRRHQETLRAAAALLKERMAHASPGPWEVGARPLGPAPQPTIFGPILNAPGGADSTLGIGGMYNPTDDAWVALMDPRLATSLILWLEDAATWWRRWFPGGNQVYAVLFAETLLRKEEWF